jgi:hypothetical protein
MRQEGGSEGKFPIPTTKDQIQSFLAKSAQNASPCVCACFISKITCKSVITPILYETHYEFYQIPQEKTHSTKNSGIKYGWLLRYLSVFVEVM